MLARHPRLTAVVAHMGAPEYAEFLELAERYERAYLDTTMVFTDFFDSDAPYPDRAAAAARGPAATRCCSAATSRPSRTPTAPLSSQRLRDRASGSATTGCAPCAGDNGVRLLG